MNRDRNLLFGILAVQLGKVTPSQLVDAAALWAADPQQDLAARLVGAGVLKEKDRALLDAFVEEAVKAHEGDSGKTLNAFGGQRQVDATFQGAVVFTDSGGVATPPTPFSQRYLDATTVPSVEEAPDRYTHVSEYGRGGMGRVLLVHDSYLGRNVALKELLPSPGDSSAPSTPARQYMNMLSRFLQEARITGQLEHPSIVPVYELGHRADGTLYYTMKLVRGRTLRQAIAEADGLQGRLQLLPHFVDLCNAIAYAHSQGVIHRDIKPANVMVGEFGETVVLDWGLAKAQGKEDIHADEMAETLRLWELGDADTGALTAYGQIMGTPAYMAPEQAKGQIDQIGEPTDVYALGVVLYELLTSEVPFRGKTAKEILDQVIKATPRPIESLEASAPAELSAIALRAMEQEPRKRYPSAKELADEVRRFQTGALVKAFDYRPVHLFRRFLFRYRVPIAALTCIVLVSLLAGVISYRRILDEKTQTIRELYVANIGLAQSRIEKLQFEDAQNLLDRCPHELRQWEWGRLAYLCGQDCMSFFLHEPSSNPFVYVDVTNDGKFAAAGGNRTVCVWNLETAARTLNLTNLASDMIAVEFSPDETELACGIGPNVNIVDLHAGSLKRSFVAGTGNIRALCYAPDGSKIVTGSTTGELCIWDTFDGTKIKSITALEGIEIGSVVANPKTDTFAVTSSDDTVTIWSIASGEQVPIPTTLGSEQCDYSGDGRLLAATSWPNTVNVLDLSTLEIVGSYEAHNAPIHGLAISHDGSFIVTGSRDKEIHAIDTYTGEHLATLRGHSDVVSDIAITLDSNTIVSGSYDGTVRVWRLNTDGFGIPSAKPEWLEYQTSAIASMEFCNSGKWLLFTTGGRFGSAYSEVKILDTESLELVNALADANILAVVTAPVGEVFSTLNVQGRVSIHRLTALSQSIDLTQEDGHATCIAMDGAGQTVAIGTVDGVVELFSAEGRAIHASKSQGKAISAIALSSSGDLVVTGDQTGAVVVWPFSLEEPVCTFSGHMDEITCIAFDPHSDRFATGSLDNLIKVWDANSGENITIMRGHNGVIRTIAYSSDGKRLLTASRDRTARIWDPSTGKELLALTEHEENVTVARFSFDDTQLATGSWDGRIIIRPAFSWTNYQNSNLDSGISEIEALKRQWALDHEMPQLIELSVTASANDVIASSEKLLQQLIVDRDEAISLGVPIDNLKIVVPRIEALYSHFAIFGLKPLDTVLKIDLDPVSSYDDVITKLQAIKAKCESSTTPSLTIDFVRNKILHHAKVQVTAKQ